MSKASLNDNSVAEKFFQQAVNLDPNFSGPYVDLVLAQGQAVDFQTRDALEALGSMEVLARRAVALDQANAEARSCLAGTLYRRGNYESGLAEVECALMISPNLGAAHGVLGAILVFSGHHKEGIAALERNIRLDHAIRYWRHV